MAATQASNGAEWPAEEAVLEAVLSEAAFEGWSETALRRAESALGIPPGSLMVLYPGGIRQIVEAWGARLDAQMQDAFPPQKLEAMRVRERITELVFWRIRALMRHREAVRRLLAHGLLPQEGVRLWRRLWAGADSMWRLAGDTATDFNFYTKRAILSGVFATTLLVALDDRSPDLAETRSFLERRIADVMRIEKCKADWREQWESLPSLTRFLGRLRYPPRAF